MSPGNAERRPLARGGVGTNIVVGSHTRDQATQCGTDGPSPGRVVERLTDTLTADPTAVGVALVALAERCPNDALIVAVRLAVEMIDARREHRRALAETTRDVAEGARELWGAGWSGRLVPHAEIMRRRYPPDGDPAAWVAGGAA